MATLSATSLLSASQALVSLGLDAPISDQLIELVNGVSNRIEDHLGRKILSQNYSEIYDFPDSGELCLKQPDVTAISFLASTTDTVLTATYTGADTHARVEVTDTALTLTSRAGSTTTSTSYTFAAYPTSALLGALSVSGWTLASLMTVPSAYLVRAGSLKAKDRTVNVEAWSEYDGTYQTDYGAGIVRFDSWGNWYASGGWADVSSYPVVTVARQQCRVDYTAGYSAVPANVETVALEVLAEAYGRIGRDGSLQSENLGDYSYAISPINSKDRWLELLSTYARRHT